MRLSKIDLKNIRLIGDEAYSIEFPSDKNVTVLLGDNGSGKTTVLDAIAFMIAPFISAFPSISDKKMADSDVHLDKEGRMSPYLEVKACFTTGNQESICEYRTRKGWENAPDSDIKEMRRYAQRMRENLEGQQLPVFAYYGTGRGQIKAPERKRNFQKVFQRWDCYNSALTPSTDFKSFFAWFDLMEDEERRERERRRDFDYRHPALEVVRRALSNFVGKKFHSPRIELHPLRFVMTENVGICMDRVLRIEQMSDGYKIIIAMVADIASRMAEANPQMANPLESSGVILIDEIDLHLHPLWQREVVCQLASTFPNVQFILTTHSPIIISGAADVAQVLRLDGNTSQLQNLTTLDIGQILLSDLFGITSLRSPMWDVKLQRRVELLGKASLNEAEQHELDTLNSELSVLQNGDTPEDIRATNLLTAIARNLGIEL